MQLVDQLRNDQGITIERNHLKDAFDHIAPPEQHVPLGCPKVRVRCHELLHDCLAATETMLKDETVEDT
jgi:hypothetical protein